MMEARWYDKAGHKKVKCLLCPHSCILNDGATGTCRVRTNCEGVLYSDNYGKIAAMHSDPIEKKPLYHYFPGSTILSIGTVGCNLRCRFCQNSGISQVSPSEYMEKLEFFRPDEIPFDFPGNLGVAYTYNEPSIWFEYLYDVSVLVADRGKKNVMVTNGFIQTGPLRQLLGTIDAFSVDMKGFTDSFYRQVTYSALKPVLKTLKMIRESGKHLEIVNLVVPGLNDNETDFTRMVQWILDELGQETVLHLSAYYPGYKATQPPTPASTINRLKTIAGLYLKYVYAGNLRNETNNTVCSSCGNLLISRSGYHVSAIGTDRKGACKKCGKLIFENF